MIIKMIAGTFGFKNKSGFITPKTPEDGPFEVSEEVGKRLVEQLKIAKIVEEKGKGEATSPATQANGKNKNPHFMKTEELIEIAKEKGIDTTGLKKAEIIAKLAENSTKEDQNGGEKVEVSKNDTSNTEQAEVEVKEAEENGDDDDIVIDDGEVAPTFDITGAIK